MFLEVGWALAARQLAEWVEQLLGLVLLELRELRQQAWKGLRVAVLQPGQVFVPQVD